MGFSVPLKEWLQNDLFEWVSNTLSEKNLRKSGFFNTKYVQTIIKEHKNNDIDHSAKLWTLLMFQDWYKKCFK